MALDNKASRRAGGLVTICLSLSICFGQQQRTHVQIVAPRGAPSAQVPSPSQALVTRRESRQAYVELNKEIFAGPAEPDDVRRRIVNLPTAQVGQITRELHELLVTGICNVLAQPDASARDVVKAIQNTQGEMEFSAYVGSEGTNTPVAEFVDLRGLRTLAVAYGILRGGGALTDTRPYLEFYTPENGAWRLKASANLDFDRRTSFTSQVQSGLAGQAWYLVWGRLFGDTGGRLKVCLYAFDGTQVQAIWRRDGLTWGKVTVAGPAVTLEYDSKYPSAERRRETLYVTPSGLE
jgi:hypothetical protein